MGFRRFPLGFHRFATESRKFSNRVAQFRADSRRIRKSSRPGLQRVGLVRDRFATDSRIRGFATGSHIRASSRKFAT
eukprot:6630189-Prymnesium_polylepis.2